MISLKLLLAAPFVFVASTALADPICNKVKNLRHRASCECHVKNGGVARQAPVGSRYQIVWSRPRGFNPEIDKCLERIR